MTAAAAVPSDPPVAELRDVHKSFGKRRALRGLDLVVARGEILALLGPNGAGKTTALAILLGLRHPDRGTARLFGADPRHSPARRTIGATPQETAFPDNLALHEILAFVRRHYPDPRPTEALMAEFGLDALAKRRLGGMSGGERRQAAVALAFAGNPRAVFLDEPTTGLDAQTRRRVWGALLRFAERGGSLFLTTHYLEEAEAMASRVALIDRGRLVTAGSVAQIKAAVDLRRLRFRAAHCPELPEVTKRESDGERHSLWCRDADAVTRALVHSGVAFRDLEIAPVSLEEAVALRLDREAPWD